MVKRGGKEVITVEIVKETYDLLKANATKLHWNTKEYINSILTDVIDKDRFLQTYAPYLFKIGYEGSTLFIKDSRLGKIAEIYLKDKALHCSICKSKSCVHVQYAFALPEVAKLYLKKPDARR